MKENKLVSLSRESATKHEHPGINELTALVLAGGHGSRLGNAIDDRPKSLIDVGGRKLMDHSLSPLLQAGVNNFVFAVGPMKHRSDMIREYVPTTSYGAVSRISREHSGGASAAIRGTLNEFDVTGHTAIMSADILTLGLDFGEAFRFHQANNADLTLIGYQAEKTESISDVNLFNEKGSTRTVLLIPAREEVVANPTIFSDIAICSPKVTDFLRNSPDKLAMFWEDLIVHLSMLGGVHTYISPKPIKHVNMNFPEDIDRVERHLAEDAS